MISIQQIEKLQAGEKIVDGFITVELKPEGTKTGKPIYSVSCYRAQPLTAGQMDSFSPKAALRNVGFYLSNLRKYKG